MSGTPGFSSVRFTWNTYVLNSTILILNQTVLQSKVGIKQQSFNQSINFVLCQPCIQNDMGYAASKSRKYAVTSIDDDFRFVLT